MRKLEALFAVLIATMAASFAWMFADTKPNGSEIILGMKVLFDPLVSCYHKCLAGAFISDIYELLTDSEYNGFPHLWLL